MDKVKNKAALTATRAERESNMKKIDRKATKRKRFNRARESKRIFDNENDGGRVIRSERRKGKQHEKETE